MKSKQWRTRLACLALTAVTVTGVAFAAGTQGSQSDPLVTLSYLTDVVLPQLLNEADGKIDERSAQLEGQLRAGGQAVFAKVEAAAGQSLVLSAGTQIILRSGEASNTDQLTDLTDGTVLYGPLVQNHLYIATADGQTVTVSADAVFLVQGRRELR